MIRRAIAAWVFLVACSGCARPVRSAALAGETNAKQPVEASSTSGRPLPHYGNADPEVEKEFLTPYPMPARRAGVQGTVRLRILVDTEGRVREAKVLNGPGHGLNEAARDAILKFKFWPALEGGEAVSRTMIYNYTFVLDAK